MGQPVPLSARAQRRGLLLGFGVFGLFWGCWSAALPDVRDRVGLDDGRLGLVLGAIALAALPAMPLAGRIVDRRGARVVVPASMLAFACVAGLLGLPTSAPVLVLGLLALGVTTGLLDVALNTATAAWERAAADRLMAAAHGCFSVGVLIGSVLTGLAREAGAEPPVVLGAFGVIGVVVALTQPAYEDARPAPAGGGRAGRPGRLLLALGLVVGASFLVEDAVQSWSALHLEDDLHASPGLSGLGPGLFAAAMAAGRFAAHAAHKPGQEARVVAAGASTLAGGVVLLGLAPTAWLALVGAVVAGAGVSVLAPTLMSAVGARSAPGRQGSDLGVVTTVGYLGFALGPVVVGALSDLTTLPTALALLGVLAAGVAVCGPLLLARPVRELSPGSARR